MSVGLQEGLRREGLRVDVPLAIDSDDKVLRIYASNFEHSRVEARPVDQVFDGSTGARLTRSERMVAKGVGAVDILLGGPPCQGHSDLNNHTRRSDPKNALYLCMARAAEVLDPCVVIIENVPPVQRDSAGVVDQVRATLESRSYKVRHRVVDLTRVGVPQRRKRHLLVASRIKAVDPDAVFDGLEGAFKEHLDRTVDWAIGDLTRRSSNRLFDLPSQMSPENRERVAQLFRRRIYDLPNSLRPRCHRDRDHSYISMYGRLRWDRPAQTVTTGFGSMGQGRFVHPGLPRTLTPHEAARLQTFPDWFDFGAATERTVLAKAIGNAVPPLLMVQVGAAVARALGAFQKSMVGAR